MNIPAVSPLHKSQTTHLGTSIGSAARPAQKTSRTDEVSISAEAQAALQADNQVRGKGSLHMRPLSLDPRVHQANVQQRIQELYDELGIPQDTPLRIDIGSQGELLVDVDHPRGNEIAAAFAEDHQLRNHVIGLHNSMSLQRIAKAARQVWDSAGEDYTSRLNALQWMKNFIAETNNMPFFVRYDGAGVQAGFEDGKGNVVDHMNNFTVPKTFA